ncbi:DUF3575 domain-containing protein [Adhaeribacter aquaticus]|uniref:DUF3575 domain-containing protein n=1 Tax=Adhaeribacter aquaticus TaxID=299567 RepID=UPI0004056E13|nr:DUF3575 domain-containing protein [Adhaeribacter aquaticus]
MKTVVILFLCFMPSLLCGQQALKPLGNRWVVKTNVLSLIAKRPTISIEKFFGKSFSVEGSFVQGRFDDILLTDHYKYQGFLLRTKKYFTDLTYQTLSPYGGIYVGNLYRSIRTRGKSFDDMGFFGYSSREFSGHSIRGGGSFGLSYFTKSRINFDAQISVGYGRYLNLNLSDPNTYSKGHPDVQVWASIGYSL